ALAALYDFDGVSYAKGAPTLKQLVAYLGDDTFLAGVREHIASNEFGNATLADLLAKWAAARGGDPAERGRGARARPRTAGVDRIRAERIPGGVRLHRTAPAGHPARRPHKLTIGGGGATRRGGGGPRPRPPGP